MEWRKTMADVGQRALPVVSIVIALVIVAAVVWFAPNRTAAVILGLLAAAILSFAILRRLSATAQTAVLWFAIGVTADAAYAKLNDIAPVTIASSLMKVVDAFVKLGDTLVRSVAPLPVDARAKIGAVTPDFVWAILLGVILFAVWSRFYTSAATGRR